MGGKKDKRRNWGSKSVNNEGEKNIKEKMLWSKGGEDTPSPCLNIFIGFRMRSYGFRDGCGGILKKIEIIDVIALQISVSSHTGPSW